MKFLKKKINPKIDFAIIGTQKGGTSALDYYLRLHQDIGMASKKETHFFDNEKIFSKSKISYRKLEGLFDFTTKKKVYGEATPIYMYWEPSIKRIWEYNPKIKLILLLRNPVERAFSHWNMEKSRNTEHEDFTYCIKHESDRIKDNLSREHRVYSYVDRGFYAQQLERINAFFPKEQVLILKYEDFRDNQEKTLNQVFDFLDLSKKDYHFEKKLIHSRPYDTNISKQEREFLINVFSEDIKQIESMLGWDCSDWKKT